MSVVVPKHLAAQGRLSLFQDHVRQGEEERKRKQSQRSASLFSDYTQKGPGKIRLQQVSQDRPKDDPLAAMGGQAPVNFEESPVGQAVETVTGGGEPSGLEWSVAFGFDQEYDNPFNPNIPRHRGVDLVLPGRDNGRGTPYGAFTSGTVEALTNEPNGGKGIIIKGDDGLFHRYFHNDAIRVKKGQRIEKGQIIGVLGATGSEDFPHVHYEVSRNLNGDPMGQTIDPSSYVFGGATGQRKPAELTPEATMPQTQVDSSSPGAFIRSIAPAAKFVEQQTGIPAEAMIGMAANETGYGKSAPRNNLFGIKGEGPAGSFTSPTWEVVNGRRVDVTDTFRAYNNPAESFLDFANLIMTSSRYAAARGKKTVEGFVQALKDGGYMTDPNYVGKITSIVGTWKDTIADALRPSIETGTLPAPEDAQPPEIRSPYEMTPEEATGPLAPVARAPEIAGELFGGAAEAVGGAVGGALGGAQGAAEQFHEYTEQGIQSLRDRIAGIFGDEPLRPGGIADRPGTVMERVNQRIRSPYDMTLEEATGPLAEPVRQVGGALERGIERLREPFQEPPRTALPEPRRPRVPEVVSPYDMTLDRATGPLAEPVRRAGQVAESLIPPIGQPPEEARRRTETLRDVTRTVRRPLEAIGGAVETARDIARPALDFKAEVFPSILDPAHPLSAESLEQTLAISRKQQRGEKLTPEEEESQLDLALSMTGPGDIARRATPAIQRALATIPEAQRVGGRSRVDAITQMHRQAEAPAPVPERIRETGQWIERQIADRFADINRMAGPQAEEAVALFQGRAGAAVLRAEEELAPMFKALGRDLVEPYNVFVKLQRDLEVALAKRAMPRVEGDVITDVPEQTRKFSGEVSGIPDILASLDDLQQRLGPRAWQRISDADAIRQSAFDRMLDEKVAAGLVRRETADHLREIYPHYNPTQVLEHMPQGKGVRGGGRQLQQLHSTIKRLSQEGSEGATEPPVRTAIRAIIQHDVAIRRNNATAAIIEGLIANPETVQQVRRLNPTQVVRGVSTETGEAGAVVQRRAGDIPGAVALWENGQRVYYQVPKDVETAVKVLDPLSMGVLGTIGRYLNAPLRFGTTTASPPFIVANAIIDAIHTFVYEGFEATARIPQGWRARATRNELYRDYIRAGGSMESFFQRQPKTIEQAIAKAGGILIDDVPTWKKLLSLPWNVAKSPFEVIRAIGEIVETAPRLAIYRTRLGRGETAETAALAGRRLMDFGRGGDAIRLANSWVLYGNARVQGPLTLGRQLRDKPGARWRLGVISAMAAATYAWNRDKPGYEDVPDWVKDTHAVVMLPGATPKSEGSGYDNLKYVAIPMRELAIFSAPLSFMFAKLDEQEPRAWEEFAMSMARGITPLGGETLASGIGGMIPGLLRTPMEMAANQKFFSGRPIESRSEETLQTSERYRDYTSRLAKELSDRLGARFGVSPLEFDFLIQGNLGSLGRMVAEMTGTATGEPRDRIPVVGDIAARIVRDYGGQIQDERYKELDRQVLAFEEQAADTVRELPEYQTAARDRQQTMLRVAQDELQQFLQDSLGITGRARDMGRGPKYIGVDDPAMTAKIDRAISKYRAWSENPYGAPRPTAEEFQLALAYEPGNFTNPLYKIEERRQSEANRQIRDRVLQTVSR